jgi:endonuclease/exonuclease/phosphatase family metal-dependent hydrolase
MSQFSIQTFNAGLLEVFGKDIVPFVKSRFEKILEELAILETDIICFQEVFENKHFEIIKKVLNTKFPYSVKAKARNLLKSPGLCVFSKYKITSASFFRFEDQQDIEKFTNHGFQKIKILISENEIEIFNLHLTAGGFTGNLETKKSSKIAKKQISQMLKHVENNEKTILIGDFNCGPRTDLETYTDIKFSNFEDVLSDFPLEDFLTWDNQNSITAMQKFDLPSDRIDHLFTHKNTKFKLIMANLNLDKVFSVIPYNLSDHFGINFKLEF